MVQVVTTAEEDTDTDNADRRYNTTIRVIAICTAIALLGLFTAIGVGCTNMVLRDGQTARSCIASGGSWVRNDCVMPPG